MAAMTFIEKYFRDEGFSLGRNEGISFGRILGRHKEKLDTARRLRDMDMADQDIHRATSLSFEELGTL